MNDENQVLDWIFDENVRAFITVMGWLVDYNFEDSDWDAIAMGLRNSDYEANSWYEYEFDGKSIARLRLSRDRGTSVVFVSVTVDPELVRQARLAIDIFQRFHLLANAQ